MTNLEIALLGTLCELLEAQGEVSCAKASTMRDCADPESRDELVKQEYEIGYADGYGMASKAAAERIKTLLKVTASK